LLGGADASCKTLAAQLPGGSGGGWNAYLSIGGQPAADNIAGQGPWYLPGPGGALVFPSHKSLIDSCSPLVPINVDNTGSPLVSSPYEVWVGSAGANCQGWTDAGGSAQVGKYTQNDSSWASATTAPCGTTRRIYCFEL